jgi:hypothetical protein
MGVRKNFDFGPQAQENLDWLQARLEAASEVETVRRVLALARRILEASSDGHVDIRRDPLPDLRIPV